MGIMCQVCMHHCNLENGQHGICKARKNENGKIISENYGYLTSIALDTIEKKPLKMFHPGSMILSVGSYGCNLKCPFCQNYEISMADYKKSNKRYVSPQELADIAIKYKSMGNIGVAYTYNEPLVGCEYVHDASISVKNAGMKNVLVTNGTASLDVVEKIIPYIDAMNIDLKGFSEEYYKNLGGSLETVKKFIVRASKDCHIELTTLIVPKTQDTFGGRVSNVKKISDFGNDSIAEMEEEAKWIASIDKHIPLHVTRFFPRYHMTDRDATDVEKIYGLADVARKYLSNVFVGNC